MLNFPYLRLGTLKNLKLTGNLEVNGQIKMTGGSPGTGKILTSDADGLASWDTAINDQTASGYFDIGTMRMQWGTEVVTDDDPVAVTLPVAFGNATYKVVIGIMGGGWTSGGAISAAMAIETKTTTTFNMDRDNNVSGTITIDWMAIGLKP